MNLSRPPLVLLFLLLSLPAAMAQSRKRSYPPSFEDATAHVHSRTEQAELKLWVFAPETPEGAATADLKRPAIVFFFGGGWRSGNPDQFQAHCRFLAERGMVAITADYRVRSRHGTLAKECVVDAKSALRWIRAHAAELGVDPDRVAAAGGSAGGHLAACLGTVEGFEVGEHLDQSSRPNAMVLFNPACVLAPVNGETIDNKAADRRERMGLDPVELSPFHHIAKGAPPALIFHGKADTTVPYRTAEMFDRAMRDAGNDSRLVGFEGMPHGFFNHGRYGNKPFRATTREMVAFFTKLGWLE